MSNVIERYKQVERKILKYYFVELHDILNYSCVLTIASENEINY